MENKFHCDINALGLLLIGFSNENVRGSTDFFKKCLGDYYDIEKRSTAKQLKEHEFLYGIDYKKLFLREYNFENLFDLPAFYKEHVQNESEWKLNSEQKMFKNSKNVFKRIENLTKNDLFYDKYP